MRIYLVRHGEVAGNAGPLRTYAGWADSKLTARGQAQAAALARRLEGQPLGVVASSDLQRARHTAAAIAAPHGLAVGEDSDLREVCYGHWEGLTSQQIEDAYPADWAARNADPEGCAPSGGESLGQLWQRLEPAWQRLVAATAATRAQTGLLVAHNGPVRLLLCRLLGMPMANYRRIQCNNCGLSWAERAHQDAPWTVACVNDTTHLANI